MGNCVGATRFEVNKNYPTLLTPASGAMELPHVAFPRQHSFADVSDDEDSTEYEEGGYLRVQIGDTFKDDRYRVLKKLGWGHFSTVWLCLDTFQQRPCALKIQKSSPHYADAARDEIRILKEVAEFGDAGKQNIVAMFDNFEHHRHVCIVFEVLGKSLLRLIQRFNYDGVPLPLVRTVVRQLLEGLSFLHDEARCIHTDLKPENVLFEPPAEEFEKLRSCCVQAAQRLGQVGWRTTGISAKEWADVARDYGTDLERTFKGGRVKIVDLGNACWLSCMFTSVIQTRQYRCPEVVLEAPYDAKVDIWSVACIAYELVTGDYLFNPKTDNDEDRDARHVALMMALLGPLPMSLINRGKASRQLFRRGKNELKIDFKVQSKDLRHLLQKEHKLDACDAEDLADFLMPMLAYEPECRISAREALKLPFLSRPPKHDGSDSPVDVLSVRSSTRAITSRSQADAGT